MKFENSSLVKETNKALELFLEMRYKQNDEQLKGSNIKFRRS